MEGSCSWYLVRFHRRYATSSRPVEKIYLVLSIKKPRSLLIIPHLLLNHTLIILSSKIPIPIIFLIRSTSIYPNILTPLHKIISPHINTSIIPHRSIHTYIVASTCIIIFLEMFAVNSRSSPTWHLESILPRSASVICFYCMSDEVRLDWKYYALDAMRVFM